MMDTQTISLATPPFDKEFFVSGGTMPESARSYVERAADHQLLDALLEAKFCYVLNSRQMGKSSLCVRVKSALQQQGVACGFVDLTRIGGQNLTAEQWYAGILGEIGRSLGLRAEVLSYWKEHSQESPMQRLFGALREVVLEKKQELVAIFVDEVDAARSLPFNADEFLTGIRECYNRRAHDPVYNLLTFCLLGAAVPSDLIRDARTTPFNIGERIYLRDFTLEEASALAKGLGKGREHLLNRVFYWTNGHPFLTQSLCTAIEHDANIKTENDVDALVSRDLFDPKARETNINLADVGNRVLNGYADGDNVDKFRADILSAYDKALRGKETLQDDESNRITAILKLSGLMRSEGKALKVRNPIYEKVFGRQWIKENMPGQEVRRQKRAFLLGVLRTSVVAGIIVAVIATLALRVDQLYHEANRERDRANYEVYVADMNLMPDLWDRGDIEQMRKLLSTTAANASRGWEWSMWNRLAHLSSEEMPDAAGFALSPDGSQLLVRGKDIIRLVDAKTFHVLKTYPSRGSQYPLSFLPDGKRMIENEGGSSMLIFDLPSGRMIGNIPNLLMLSGNRAFSPDGTWALGTDQSDLPVKADLIHFTTQPIGDQQTGIRWRQLSPSGKLSIWSEEYTNTPGKHLAVSIRDTKDWTEVARLNVEGSCAVAISPDDKHALVGDRFGWMSYWDIGTGKQLWRIRPYSDLLQRLEFDADGKLVSTVGRERFGKVFSISDKGATLVRTYPDAGNTMISPGGDRVYYGYFTLRAYDLPGQDPIRTVRFPFVAAGGGILEDGTAFAGTPTSVGYALNVFTNSPPKMIWDGRSPIAGFDPFRRWLFVLGKTKGYDVIDTSNLQSVGHVDVDQKDFYPIRGYAKSAKILIGGKNKVQTWDFATKKLSLTFDGKDQAISAAKVSPDERTVAIGMTNGDIVLEDLASGSSRHISDHLAGIYAVHFSADGSKLFLTSDDDTASVIDVKAGVVLLKLVGHSQTVNAIDVTADGHRIVTGADDGTARIWDASTGRELTLLDGGGEVGAVRFLNDGRTLATVCKDGTVKLWTTDNSWKQN